MGAMNEFDWSLICRSRIITWQFVFTTM